MYILCIDDGGTIRAVAAPRKRLLTSHMALALDKGFPWRLWNAGWIDGSDEAWHRITLVPSVAELILY